MMADSMFAVRTVIAAAVSMSLLAAPIPALSAQRLSGSYAYSFGIRFSGYRGEAALADFPVLVRLSASLNEFKYAKCKLANGGDLRFSDANGNLLPSEVERWDPEGESLVWVKVPELTSETVITAHYGCVAPDAVAPSDVWDEHFVGVWHLGAGPGAVTQPDSTSNGQAFHVEEDFSDGVDPGVSGAAGYAAAFHRRADGYGAYFIGPNDGGGNGSRYSGFPAFTVEFWSKEDDNDKVGTAASNPYIMKMGDIWYSYRNGNRNGERLSFNFLRDGQTTGNWLNGSADEATPTPARWNHTARVYDGNPDTRTVNRAVYFNGESQTGSWTAGGTLDGAMKYVSSATFSLGGQKKANGGSFPGAIDEVRISNIARSADWVQATYDTVNDPAFATYEFARDWKSYGYRFAVTFGGAPAGTTLADFPVLVRIAEDSPSDFHYADCRMPNGGDLRFCVDDGEPLPCEVERWNTNGESLVWVKVPALARGTKLTAYYGREDAPEVSAAKVWDEHYLAVWHLNAAAGESTQPDSTAYNHPFGVQAESPTGSVASGTNGIAGLAVATGLRSDGKGCFFLSDKDDGYFFDRFSAFTMEVWTYQDHHAPADSGKRRYILRKGGPSNYDWVLYETATGRTGFKIEALNDGEILPDDSAAVPQRAEWNYSAVSWDGLLGECASYLNGSALTLSAAGMVAANWKGAVGAKATGLNLGNYRYNGASTYESSGDAFRGVIDEVRISDVMRSPEWVQATHDTIRPGSGFATMSPARRNLKPTVMVIR